MTHVLHVQFNKDFENDKKMYDLDVQSEIISAVSDCARDVIKQKYANIRCNDLVNDKIRRRVTTQNLYVFAVLRKYVLIFVGIREIGKRIPIYDKS